MRTSFLLLLFLIYGCTSNKAETETKLDVSYSIVYERGFSGKSEFEEKRVAFQIVNNYCSKEGNFVCSGGNYFILKASENGEYDLQIAPNKTPAFQYSYTVSPLGCSSINDCNYKFTLYGSMEE